jgi:hypothetical protein
MKGHIMIFGGFEGEDPVIYHAVYGIKRDDGRMIYPKAVVKNLLERGMPLYLSAGYGIQTLG